MTWWMVLGIIALVWAVAGVLVAWGMSRWYRFVRGDFD